MRSNTIRTDLRVSAALVCGLVIVVGCLLRNRASNIDSSTRMLSIAIRANDTRLVLFALDHGADPNVTDRQLAEYPGWQRLWDRLITKRVRVGPDYSPLLMMSMLGNFNPEITRALLEHGADANCRDLDGMTPLMHAVESGRPTSFLQMLLDHGADPNSVNREGFTAAWLARDRSDAIAIKSLLNEAAKKHK